MRRRVSKKKRRERAWVARIKNIGTGSEQRLMMENLGMLLESGMDVVAALSAIQSEMRTRRMRQVLARVVADIQGGECLSVALRDTHMLPDYVMSLIRLGEESGRLVDNLQVIIIQQQKEREFRSKLRSAMMYPILVLVITALLALGMAVWVLPRLASVFESLNAELPVLTRALIGFGGFMQEYGFIVAPAVIVVGLVLLFILFGWSKTKIIGQWLLWWLPGVRRLIVEVELARFGYILGTLLEAGLPIVQAVESLRDATVYFRYKRFYGLLAQQINMGESIQSVLQHMSKIRNVIPISIQQMIVAGEQSGNLPGAFAKIGLIYEAKTETTAKNLTTVLEPILLFVVWGGVAGVALAVIMPIYSLIGGLNDVTSSNAQSTSVTPSTEVQVEVTEEEAVVPEPESESLVTVLEIANTPTNDLNVREQPGVESELVARVLPGQTFEYTEVIEAEDGSESWYEIIVSDTDEGIISGWVIGDYVVVQE